MRADNRLVFPKKQVITGKIHLMEKTVFRILLPETFFANQIFFMNEIGIMHIFDDIRFHL